MMEASRIIILSVVAAVLYGIAHDQITARICVEYFTIGHPLIVATSSPTALGLVWGIVATWWVGLILGVLLALAARAGRWPKLTATQLVRPIMWLLAAMGVLAFVAGWIGFALAQNGSIQLAGFLATRVPVDKHIPFLAVGAAHLTSYGAGFVGGVILTIVIVTRRYRVAVKDAVYESPATVDG